MNKSKYPENVLRWLREGTGHATCNAVYGSRTSTTTKLRFKTIQKIMLALMGVAFVDIGLSTRAVAVNFTPEPLSDKTASYSTIILNSQGTGDEADIYYPVLSSANIDSLPVVLFLQGANIDKSLYSNYAQLVASYGFIVVIPNHFRFIPQLGTEFLATETPQIENFVNFIKRENANSSSPLENRFDTNNLSLSGHSAGGSVGLTGIGGNCLTLFCPEPFVLSENIKAGAFYGTQLPDLSTGDLLSAELVPTNNENVPVALIHGERDGAIPIERGRKTFELIEAPAKAFITVEGANHRGIANEDNPGDPIRPTLAQEIATETIARWSALFLRATVLEAPEALDYVFETGDAQEPIVTVISEPKSVREPASRLGLLALGVLAVLKIYLIRED